MLFLTNDSWLQIYKYSTWYVLSGSSLREEGIEWIITSSKGFVAWHLTIRLDSMLQAVKLPTSVAHLATSLANVDGDTFPLKLKKSNVCKFTTANYFNIISKRFSHSWYFHQPNAEQASSLPTLLYMWVLQSDATKCYFFLSYILKFFQCIVLIFLRKAKSSILSSCQPHLYKFHSKWKVKEKSCLTISNLDTKLRFFRCSKQINKTNNNFIISSEITFL